MAAWSTMAPMGTARAEEGAVAHPNGKIYVWGGYQGSFSVFLNSAEAYDIATNTWSAIATLPSSFRGPAAAVGLDGSVYSFGGYDGGYTGASYKYDVAANSWTAIAPMPVARWEARALRAADGRIFVFGGWNAGLTPQVGDEVQIYDPTTNTWAIGAAMPTALFGAGAGTDAAGLMHLYGGITTSYNPSQAHIVYNTSTNTWVAAANTPAPARAYTNGTTGSDGNLYLFGGDNDIVAGSGTFYNQVDFYNPTTAVWSSGTALPVAMTEAASVAAGSNVYVLGGLPTPGTAQSTVYRMATTPAVITSTAWTGATSTDWYTASNWTNGVPTNTVDALISAGAPRYPVVTSGTATAQKLTLATGGSLTQSGGTLSLSSDFSNSGTFTATGGTVDLTGSGSQSVGGTSQTTFWNLTVGASGATLSGAADMQRVLSLTGNLSANGKTFTLLSNAGGTAMVLNNGGTVTGNATVQRYIDPSLNAGLGYRHYSSPVASTTVADLATTGFTPVLNSAYNSSATPATTSSFPTVFGYDEARVASATNNLAPFDKGWVSPAAATDPLTVGRGYTANLGASEKVDLVGTLTNGTVPVGALSYSGTANSGWQLLGNPYPAPLDWNVARTGLPTGVIDAIYVFKSAAQYTGSYQFYQNGLGTLPGGLVPAMQGFFLRVSQNVPAFSFQNSWRSTVYQNPTFNRGTTETRPVVQLDLVTAAGTHEPTFVYFENGATAGFDAHYDADKLSNSTGLNLSSEIAGGQRLAVNGLPVLGTAALTVPLTVGVPAAGTYTLTAAQLLNLPTTPVYLRDRQTGTLTNLASQASYSFTTAAGALLTGRFELVFSPQSPLAVSNVALAAQVGLYPNPAHSAAFVELPAALGRTAVTASLMDALGRTVRTRVLPAQGAAAHQLSLAGVAKGVYTLHLATAAGVLVKKLVVE